MVVLFGGLNKIQGNYSSILLQYCRVDIDDVGAHHIYHCLVISEINDLTLILLRSHTE